MPRVRRFQQRTEYVARVNKKRRNKDISTDVDVISKVEPGVSVERGAPLFDAGYHPYEICGRRANTVFELLTKKSQYRYFPKCFE